MYVPATGNTDAESTKGCPVATPRLKEQMEQSQPVRVSGVPRRPPGGGTRPAPLLDGYRNGCSCARWGKKERAAQSQSFVTRSSNLIMVSAAARKFALSECRDQMVLVMASHAARVKVKARQAKDEAVRQVGHRTERYQQFKGRRSTALDEGGHAHRARRFQAMLLWLEA